MGRASSKKKVLRQLTATDRGLVQRAVVNAADVVALAIQVLETAQRGETVPADQLEAGLATLRTHAATLARLRQHFDE